MREQTSTLTERGQVSLPAALRRRLQLKTGQRLRWEAVSDTELRIVVEASDSDPMAALGYGASIRKGRTRPTKEWMKEIREGE